MNPMNLKRLQNATNPVPIATKSDLPASKPTSYASVLQHRSIESNGSENKKAQEKNVMSSLHL